MQVEDIARTEIALLAAAPNEEPRVQNLNGSSNHSGGIPDELVVPDVSLLEDNSTKDHTGSAKLSKRGRKRKETALRKCAKRLGESAIDNYSHSGMETECLLQKQEHHVSNSSDNLKNVIKRSKRKMHRGFDANKMTLENVPDDPINLATPNENFGTETSGFPEVEKVSQFPEKGRKNGRACKKTHFGRDAKQATPENAIANPVSLGAPDDEHENFGTELLALPEVEKVCQLPENSRMKGRGKKKARFGNDANMTILEDVPAHPIGLGTPNDSSWNLGTEVSAFQEIEKVSQFPEKNNKNGGAGKDQRLVQYRRKSKKQKLYSGDDKLREKQSSNQNQHDGCAIRDLTTTPGIATSTDQKREHEKQDKSSSVCIITCEYDNVTQEKHVAQENRSEFSEIFPCCTDAKNLDPTAKKVGSEKHERLDNEFHCAFCLSSEESEVDQLRLFIYFHLFLIIIFFVFTCLMPKFFPLCIALNVSFILKLYRLLEEWSTISMGSRLIQMT